MKMNTTIKNRKLLLPIVFVVSFMIAFNVWAQDYCGEADCVESFVAAAELNPDTKAKIEENKPIYQSVAQKHDIPWQVLAAIHCREAGCDPTRSMVSGEDLGTTNPDDGNTYTSFEQSADVAAQKLKNLVKSIYNLDLNESPNDDILGYAFLAYNRGAMYRDGINASGSSCGEEWENTPYDKSPYAVNFIDESHKNMNWNGCIDSGMTHADANLGAMTIYKILKNEDCAPGETVDKEKLKTSLADMKSTGKYGGGPNSAGVNEYLETFEVPIWTEAGTEGKMNLTAHKEVAGSLRSIFQKLTAMKYPVSPTYTGAFRHGQEAGSSSCISSHRFGIAIDVNYDVNPYCSGYCPGYGPRRVTPEVAKVFEEHGWTVWGAHVNDGGDFSSMSDSMHFSVNDSNLLPGMCK